MNNSKNVVELWKKFSRLPERKKTTPPEQPEARHFDLETHTVFLIAKPPDLPSIALMFLRLTTLLAAAVVTFSLASCCCM